jgi:hypothetical protein
MSTLILKAFVLCNEIADTPGEPGQKDLRGAGLTILRATGPFPVRRSLSIYFEMSDQKPAGRIQIALMRADSGRRKFLRSMQVEFPNRLQSTIGSNRIHRFTFPSPGVYFAEIWYDGEWLADQRLEVT